jgi:hypothetical protein
LPVWKNVIAGSWLIASVCIERTTHSSDATVPSCGRSSLNHSPSARFLCSANLNMDGATGNRVCPLVMPVRRWPFRIEAGSS